MTTYSMQPPGEKMGKAIKEYSELLQKYPEKKRIQILQQVELKFDLTPKECEFLNGQFLKEEREG